MPPKTTPKKSSVKDLLEEKVTKLDAIVNSFNDWIFTIDCSYTILEELGNHEFAFQILGDSLNGKNLVDLIPPEDWGRFKTKMDAVFKGGNEVIEWKFSHNEYSAYFQSSVTPVVIGGKIESVLLVSRDISEIRQAQFDSEIQKDHLDTIINNAPIAIFAKNGEGLFTMVNDYYCRVTHKKREELVGKGLHHFRDREHVSKVIAHELDVLVKGVPSRYESWLGDEGEKQMLFDFIKVPIRNKEGKVEGLIGIGRNITKVRDIEQRLKLAIEIAREFIIEWDFSKKQIQFSADFYHAMGIGPGICDGPIDKAFNHLVSKDDRLDIVKWLRQQYSNSNNLPEYEIRLRDGQGNLKWFIVRGQITSRNSKNEARMAVCILIDVTDIKALQMELKENNQQLNQLIGSVPGVVFTEINGEKSGLTFISSKCWEIFGYSPEELLVKPNGFRSLIMDDYLGYVLKEINKSFAHGTEFDIKYKAFNQAGKTIWIWEKGKFRTNINGNSTNTFDGILMNISESMQVEERISSATIQAEEKERRRLAQEIHDSVQQILISSLFQFRSLDDKIQGLNGDAYRRFQDGINFIKEAINEARAVSHNLVPNSIYDFGLHATISNLIDDVSRSNNIQILFEENIKENRFDEKLELNVYRIIQESINNIRKYAQTEKIYISLISSNEMLSLSIIDYGIGFDTEKVNIQNSFGLSSIQNRTNSLNGSLRIESEKGKGTRIQVEIPLN